MRARSVLLRAGAYHDLYRLVETERGITLDASLEEMYWEGEKLAVRFSAAFAYRDGSRFTFHDGRWTPPLGVRVPRVLLDATRERARLDLYVRSREDGADHPLKLTRRSTGELSMSGECLIDVARPHVLTPGSWDLIARLDAGGWIVESRLQGTVDVPSRGLLEPYRTLNGNVSLRVRTKPLGPLRRMLRRVPGASRVARRLLGDRPRPVVSDHL